MKDEVYDCLIVGGGVAGLSAATHLAWHNRKVRVFDRRTGPLFFTLSKLYNVPGMPAVTGVQLQKILFKQATDLGAEHEKANVVAIEGEIGNFRLETESGNVYQSKTLLLATGVARYHPTVDGDWQICLKYAAKCNMFYCPDCEAPELVGKSTLVISTGNAKGGINSARHLHNFTRDLSILFTHKDFNNKQLNEKDIKWLESKNIPWQAGQIKDLKGLKGCISAVVLEDGTRFERDAYFVSSPKIPRSDLAKQLGLKVTEKGHIEPISQRGNTNVEGVWIAGDVRPMTQQVAVAMGTGNIAAVHIDQYLTYKLPM